MSVEALQEKAYSAGMDLIGTSGGWIPALSFFVFNHPISWWVTLAGAASTIFYAGYKIYDRESLRKTEKRLKHEEARQLQISNDEREFKLNELKRKSEFSSIVADTNTETYNQISELEAEFQKKKQNYFGLVGVN